MAYDPTFAAQLRGGLGGFCGTEAAEKRRAAAERVSEYAQKLDSLESPSNPIRPVSEIQRELNDLGNGLAALEVDIDDLINRLSSVLDFRPADGDKLGNAEPAPGSPLGGQIRSMAELARSLRGKLGILQRSLAL